MKRLTFCASIVGLFALLNVGSALAESNDDYRILDCLYERNSLGCAKKRADAELDRIEAEVTGRQSSVTFSRALEEAGALMVDGARSIMGGNGEPEDEGAVEGGEDDSGEATSGERKWRNYCQIINSSSFVETISESIKNHYNRLHNYATCIICYYCFCICLD